ncbi:MAG TPA: hypothetical protein PKH94_08980 [Bacteroidales bacterium]|nr:hypothetical protein [Bacteroidales bacterium]HNS47358.1 hypothetical protein [Bacteroidales bacterium]
MNYGSAQVITQPDPTLRFDRTKGIIVLYPSMDGKFYLNFSYLTDLKANDTIFLVNAAPGNYHARFDWSVGSNTQQFTVNKRNVVEMILSPDSLVVRSNAQDWYTVANRAAGKLILSDLKECLYWNTHLAFFTLGDLDPYPKAGTFNSFTTILGYSVSKGFGLGAGISYNNYDISTELQNISMLPVFIDIRSHFSARKTAPFFKIDIGYTVLLSGEGLTYKGGPTLDRGGIYFSPGLGLRIALTDKLQFNASIEYSMEKVHYTAEWNPGWYDALNFLKINFGIGFTKQLKRSLAM